jgi:hypothetical protein
MVMAWCEEGSSLRKRLNGFLLKNTPRCQGIAFMMSQTMDRDIPLQICFTVLLHRLACDFCANYRKHLELIRKIS